MMCTAPEVQPPAALYGSPALTFAQRLFLQGRKGLAALDFLALATSSWLALLLGRSKEHAADWPASQFVLAAYACLAAASLATLFLAGRSPSSTVLKGQQALSLMLRLGWIALCGRVLELMAAPWPSGTAAGGSAADDLQAADGWLPWLAALTYHTLQLLASSLALCMLLQGLRRTTISLSIPLHLLLLAACSRRAGDTCAAGPLSSPTSQQLTHQLHTALRPLAFCTPLPLSLFRRLDAVGECRAVLRFLQAFLGTAVPLAWQAIAESQLFAQHQEQRAAAGLPPERGPSAAILTAVQGLLHQAVRPHLYIFAAFLTGSLWDWSCLLSSADAV